MIDTLWDIENDTGWACTVALKLPADQHFIVGPGETIRCPHDASSLSKCLQGSSRLLLISVMVQSMQNRTRQLPQPNNS